MSITATQIANRAIQRVGEKHIADGALLTEQSKPAKEVRACYESLRRAELRRNVWRFSIRTVALRPLDDDSKLVTFGAYASGTTYAAGDIILDTDGNLYASLVGTNLAHTPQSSPLYWELFFGSQIAQEYITTYSAAITYAIGDHVVGTNGLTYTSLQAANINHTPQSNASWWELETTGLVADDDVYFVGELVYRGNKVYTSLENSNDDLVTDTSAWLPLSTVPTVSKLRFLYPIGVGPGSDVTTRSAYRLPNGYLRVAPQSPKAGSQMPLGAPSGLSYSDWNFESQYFTTMNNGVILFRFAADIADVTQFDPLFVEGFAARIAFEICEPLTQSTSKLQGIASEYKQFMTDARIVNGIETGPTEPPEDSYITSRY